MSDYVIVSPSSSLGETMKRATITLPDDLEQALAMYCQDQTLQPSLTAVVQAALRNYLAARGYLTSATTLKITPAKQGSGQTDSSVHHDEYFADR